MINLLSEYHLLENLEDGVIVISEKGIIEDINLVALKIFGYQYDEVIGNQLSLFMFEKDAKFHNLYIQKYLTSGIENLLREGMELEGKDKFNRKIQLYISVVKYINDKNEIKFVGFIRELQNLYSNELANFKSIFIISNEFRLACNQDGKFYNKNELTNLLGYDFNDDVSDSIFDHVHKIDKDKLHIIFKNINENLEINNEVIRLVKKNQDEIYFSWNSNIVPVKSVKNSQTIHNQLTIANDVTEIIKKDEEISIFETTMNENPNGILIANNEGKIEYVNEQFLKYLMYPKKEIIDKNLFLASFFIEKEIKPDIRNTIQFDGIWQGEIEYEDIHGDMKTFFITIKGIKNINDDNITHYIEMIEEISSFKMIYDEIEFERNKLKQILEQIPEGIILFDNQGKLIELNSSIKSWFSSIYHIDLSLSLQGIKNNIYEDNIFLQSIKELMKDNEKIKSIQPIPGIFLKILQIKLEKVFIFIIYNITNDKKIEQFRKQIISMVSHELRTPNSSITQSLYNFITYEEKLEDYEKKRIIQIAYNNSKLLGEIVDDLLVISQIENNKLSLNKSTVDITESLKEVISQFENKLKNKKIKVTFYPTSNCTMFGDIKRISQIFRIILDNSIKYSPNNSYIDIREKKFNLETKGIQIEIKDYGIGISDEDIPFLFNRFFRAKNASNIKGTGLGLSIAKELIELHNGEIKVSSKINAGTSFQIFFPS